MRKIEKEKRIIDFMIRFYCRRIHGNGKELCPECSELRDYSFARLDRCPFGDNKKACRHCSIHCYKPEMREKVRKVMRYSGPRMFLYSPIEAFKHTWRR